MEFSRPEYWSGWPFSSPEDLPNPGIEPRSHVIQVDSLPAEPQGKAKNIGVGSLSILQQIFPTQESNQDLLHCKRILYQLGYQGSPTSLQKQSHVRKLQALGSDYWLLKKLKRGYTSKLPLPLENLGMNQKRNIRIRHIKVFVQVHSFFKFLYSART